MGRILLRVCLAALSVIVAFASAEALVREIDGFAVRPLRLQRRFRPNDDDSALARKHAGRIPLSEGAKIDWFDQSPNPVLALPADPELERRYWFHPGAELPAVYEWNAEFLRFASCQEPWKSTTFSKLTDVFAFDSTDGSMFPTFRFLRGVHMGSGLNPNNFGWRGPNIRLDKPARSIRLAFVGASTTIANHGYVFSYPEFIEHWLNLWAATRGFDVHFEVINAAREGINSDSISAIVRQELGPVEPDLVVYYEGANHFWPSNFIDWPGGVIAQRPNPPLELLKRWRLSAYSEIVGRLNALDDRLGGAQSEPRKPSLPVRWPGSLNENDPDLHHPELPLYLPIILKNFDSIRRDLDPIGSRLILTSFVWLVSDGLKLDRTRHDGLYRYLNETFWPFTYRHLRRTLDFQNRVFAKYARVNGLDFLDVAGRYPQDPDLFLDAIHTTPAGVRLQGWVVFQQLLPVLARKIAARELPRPMVIHRSQHPAFSGGEPKKIPVQDVMAACETRLRSQAPSK